MMRKHGLASGEEAAAEAATSIGSGTAAATSSGQVRRAPVQQAAWEHELRIDRRLHFFGFALHTATQAASLLAWSTLPASERWQRVGSVAVQLAFLSLPWLVPALYLRWRRPILIVERIQFFMWPLLRQPKGIQESLNNEPKLGARGALQDLLRSIWGARLVAVALAPLVQPLNMLGLLPHAALQLYALAVVRSNRSLCTTPLLAHPVSKARVNSLHNVMRLAALALPGGAGHELTRPERMSADQECAAFLNFVGVCFGVLLPLWLLVKTEPCSSLARWDASWDAAAEGLDGGQQQQPLHLLAACMEAALRALCGRSWLSSREQRQQRDRRHRWQLEGWQRGLLWWQVLALSWMCSVALAGA